MNNAFVNDPIGLSYGLVNGSPVVAGGVSGIVNGNVFLGTNTIDGEVRGCGIEVGNTSPTGQTLISNNIFSNNSGGSLPAIMLQYGANVTNTSEAVGINNLDIEDNVVYQWTSALSVDPGMQPGGTGAWRSTTSKSAVMTSSRLPAR